MITMYTGEEYKRAVQASNQTLRKQVQPFMHLERVLSICKPCGTAKRASMRQPVKACSVRLGPLQHVSVELHVHILPPCKHNTFHVLWYSSHVMCTASAGDVRARSRRHISSNVKPDGLSPSFETALIRTDSFKTDTPQSEASTAYHSRWIIVVTFDTAHLAVAAAQSIVAVF